MRNIFIGPLVAMAVAASATPVMAVGEFIDSITMLPAPTTPPPPPPEGSASSYDPETRSLTIEMPGTGPASLPGQSPHPVGVQGGFTVTPGN